MELIKIEENGALLSEEVTKKIVEFEKQIKLIKEEEDKLKQSILTEMEKRNIIKLDNENLTISYVAPYDRESFDSKAFKEAHQDLYDEYVKMTPVSSSIRIKVK